MRRLASLSLVAVLALAAAAAPAAVAAKGKPALTPKPAPVVTIKAVAGSALPGEQLPVEAMLTVHGKKSVRTFTATAVVHFASGDVTITLAKPAKSNGLQVKGSVTVPADEAAGAIRVDVSAVVDGVTLGATAQAAVEAPIEAPSGAPSASPAG